MTFALIIPGRVLHGGRVRQLALCGFLLRRRHDALQRGRGVCARGLARLQIGVDRGLFRPAGGGRVHAKREGTDYLYVM